jgi:hypothetical protein
MKITNYEIVQRLSAINIFINIEKEGGKALLSPVGEYALNYNRKILANAYEPYAETLKSLEDDEEKIKELLKVEVEINDYRKITVDDFREGITAPVIMALDFMIE